MSRDAVSISRYLCDGAAFDEALAGFSPAFAARGGADYTVFTAAIHAGCAEATEEPT